MLVVKVYVNTEQIDEIQIHNEGVSSSGWANYHIENHPELGKIKHLRSRGYKYLLRDALNKMIADEYLQNTINREHKS
jgi:hypothetical protein